MIKFGFCIQSALKNIARNKLLSVAKFLTSIFCMIVVFVLIGSFGGSLSFVRERCDFRDVSSLKMYVAEDINDLPKNPEDAEHFIFYARNNRVTCGKYYLAGIGISVTDSNFADLFEDFIREGRFISDVKNECVIGYEIAEKYKIGISREVLVGSKKYKVCGISRNAGYRNTILICNPTGLEIGCPQIYISSQMLYGNGLTYSGEGIPNYFASMVDLSDLIPVVAACAVMLIFSAVNIFNIMIIYAKKSVLRTQIFRCLGASKGAIFSVFFLENILINTLAFALALVLLNSVKNTISTTLSIVLEYGSAEISVAFFIAAILSLIYSIGGIKREAVCIL